jgi:hypothetical protein
MFCFSYKLYYIYIEIEILIVLGIIKINLLNIKKQNDKKQFYQAIFMASFR